MPHTNNPAAKDRAAKRQSRRKPAFLQRKNAPTAKAKNATGERREHASLIAEFHAITKRIAASSDEGEREKLEQQLADLGGLEKYQAASIHGGDKARGGETGKQCVQWLKELKVGVIDRKGKGKEVDLPREKLRLLDVGGISGTSYSGWSWIDALYIDLNPQAEHVVKSDFFDFPIPEPDELYDVVGLSLVLNFVGSLSGRGDMLRHAHKYVKQGGYLYVVLPLPCLTNSRYLNHDRFAAIAATTGWEKVKQRDSAKLTFWMLRQIGDGRGDDKVFKREEVRGGLHRNNFCILVNLSSAAISAEDSTEQEDNQKQAAPSGAEEEEEEEEEWGGIVDD